MPRRLRRSERGQAITETMLVTWLLIVFIAMAWQMFIVNDTIFRSITGAHQEVFDRAQLRNCFTRGSQGCTYGTNVNGTAARVIWDRPQIPEAFIPIVGMFQPVLGQNVQLKSIYRPDGRKRTIMGSGSYTGVGRVLTCFSPTCIAQ
jgi:hypothetical protein